MSSGARRTRGLALLAVAASAALLLTVVVDARAQEVDGAAPEFEGSAAAVGVRVQLVLPGAPLTDTLIDAGGPAAQVAAASSRGALSYAALPDPGQVTETLPGVLAGLLGQGLAGLPPLALPALPAYPFSVTADDLTPEASLGAGPYELRVTAAGPSGTARATGGVAASPAGRAALLEATAAIDARPDGVTVTATSITEGITVGPLVVGQVRSTATMRLDADGGAPTRSRTTTVTGLQVGGLPVRLTADAIDVAGTPVPLPLGAALSSLLAGAGIRVELLPAGSFPDRVVAPALRITMPVDGSAAGAGTGTATLVLGGATASLTAGADSSATDAGDGATVAAPSDLASGGGVGPAIDAPSPSAPDASGPALLPTEPIVGPGPLTGLFDVRNLYLLVAACALGCWGMGQLIRTLEVKE